MMAVAKQTPEPPEDESIDRGPAADPESVARTIVLDQLTTRARSRHELAETLARRGVPAPAAERVLDRMTEIGLVDDEEFSRSWVEQRQRSRGLGRRALAQELRRKGISPETASEALAAVGPDEERAAAAELVRRRLATMRGLTVDAQTRRLAGMLARKGYPAGLAFAVVREALDAELSADAEL